MDTQNRAIWLAIRQACVIIIRAIERELNLDSCIVTREERQRVDQYLRKVRSGRPRTPESVLPQEGP